MMKILVLSDNHGHWSKVNEIIDRYRANVDYILHCGDSEFPADDPIWDNVDYVVRGNMDFDPQFRLNQVIESPQGNIYLTHGHLESVKMTKESLISKAKELNCQYVFHGHTHALYATFSDGIILANPGSISRSRGTYKGETYMLLTVEDSIISTTFFDLDHHEIKELTSTFQRSV